MKLAKNTKKPGGEMFCALAGMTSLTLNPKLCNSLTSWNLIKTPQKFVHGFFLIKITKICHKSIKFWPQVPFKFKIRRMSVSVRVFGIITFFVFFFFIFFSFSLLCLFLYFQFFTSVKNISEWKNTIRNKELNINNDENSSRKFSVLHDYWMAPFAFRIWLKYKLPSLSYSWLAWSTVISIDLVPL